MVKQFCKSKTLWVNVVVAIILGILDVPLGLDPKTELLLVVVANIVLRVITTEGLKLK